MMPGMNGAELAEVARGAFPNLVVLFTTGYTDETLLPQGALDRGADLLRKPFLPAQLAQKVRELLDKPAKGQRRGGGA